MHEYHSVRRSGSFVLRIWWEEQGDNEVWRGWVQHAASGESAYLDRVTDLVAFVEARTGSLSKPASAPEQVGEGGDPTGN